MILGLPELTVFAVGGTILLVLVLLIIWGIAYPKVED
jgi:hypothetical protein